MSTLTRRSPSPDELHLTLSPRSEQVLTALIVVVFAALALGFSTMPIFEAPDEIEHYRFIRILAETGQLPGRLAFNREFFQPPLYYTLGALISLPISDDDFETIEARVNPAGFQKGIYSLPNWQSRPDRDHKVFYIHTRAEEFPYTASSTARAVHLLRLFSVALGVGTLIVSIAIFRLVWPGRPEMRLLALGILAFWPMFDYASGYMTNDALLIFLSALVIYLAMRWLKDGPSTRRALMLGLALGAAWLTKASALTLIAPVGLAVGLEWRRGWRAGLVIAAAALAVAGWWYVQGAVVYGDPTGLAAINTVIPNSYIPLAEITLGGALDRLGDVYRLVWARFGWLRNIAVSPAMYVFYDLLTLAGLFGTAAGARLWKSGRRDGVGEWLTRAGPLAAMALATAAAEIWFVLVNRNGGLTARYLLPALPAWAALLAVGIDRWVPARLKPAVGAGGPAVMAVLSAVALLVYFLPVYRPMPLPARIEYPLAIQFEDRARLIGVSQMTLDARPGDIVRLRLYWQALRPSQTPLLAYLVTDDPAVITQWRVPGGGNLPATEWQAGQTWAEEWVIAIPPDAAPQGVYWFTVGLWDQQAGRALQATISDGALTYTHIGAVVLHGPPASAAPQYRFRAAATEPVVGLAEWDIALNDSTAEVCLTWIALGRSQTDYDIHLEVVDSEGAVVTADTRQLTEGRFPTSVWQAGEVIHDCSTLSVPDSPGEGSRLHISLLDPHTGLALETLDSLGRGVGQTVVIDLAP